MVKIELKGTTETDDKPYKHSISIIKFRGGVYLQEPGTVVIQLSSKKLTKEIQEFLNKKGNCS